MTDTCTIPSHPTDNAERFDPGPGKHVLFFGDPMCSWCWGFAPELTKIEAAIKDRAQLHLVMGGLRPDTAEAWDPEMRHYIRHHWQDVQAKTGQPFAYERFDDADFIYNTEPACRALVTVRILNESAAPAYYESLQRAFYSEGKDICRMDVLADLAVSCGLERDRFAAFFASPEARSAVEFDFSRTRSFGVTGFPSVLCADHGQYGFLSLGYRPYDSIAPLLDEWLSA